MSLPLLLSVCGDIMLWVCCCYCPFVVILWYGSGIVIVCLWSYYDMGLPLLLSVCGHMIWFCRCYCPFVVILWYGTAIVIVRLWSYYDMGLPLLLSVCGHILLLLSVCGQLWYGSAIVTVRLWSYYDMGLPLLLSVCGHIIIWVCCCYCLFVVNYDMGLSLLLSVCGHIMIWVCCCYCLFVVILWYGSFVVIVCLWSYDIIITYRPSSSVNFYILIFFSKTTGPIETKLARNDPLEKKNCCWSKVHKRNKRPKGVKNGIVCSETTGSIRTDNGQTFYWIAL